MKTWSVKPAPIVCKYCGREFTDKYALERHIWFTDEPRKAWLKEQKQ